MGLFVASSDFVPVATVVVGAALALIGALVSIIFWDMRADIKRAVDTLEKVLHRQEDQEERLQWVEGFHPTKSQLVQRSRGRGNDST